jgi:hypothetical protein
MRHLRHFLRAALLAIPCALSFGSVAQDTLEYPVKAAFLVRFGDYVDWPASAFASPSAPLVVCVVGEDPFGAALDKAAASQQVHGRPVTVKRLKGARADSGCHIAFIAAAEPARLSQQLEALHGVPALTVTDVKSGPSGTVNFVVKDERVRFDIDEDAAMQNGLTVSSKLLALALNVRPRRGAR